jgi:hypothetical protein
MRRGPRGTTRVRHGHFVESSAAWSSVERSTAAWKHRVLGAGASARRESRRKKEAQHEEMQSATTAVPLEECTVARSWSSCKDSAQKEARYARCS